MGEGEVEDSGEEQRKKSREKISQKHVRTKKEGEREALESGISVSETGWEVGGECKLKKRKV